MIPTQRHLFDIPDEVVYLNCAYMSPQLKSVREAGRQAVDRKSRPWNIVPDDFFTESETARGLFAQIISDAADNIAIIPAVSYGMAVVTSLLEFNAGEEVLVLDEQFPSNVYPWREIARQHELNMTTVNRPADMGWTRAIIQAINSKTRVVALPHVHWTDGSLIDLVRVSRAVRSVGAALVLDVTQSVGALPISVTDVQPDFLISAAYKWLLGPYSLGFMYIHPKYHDRRPLENNWLNRGNSEDFAGLVSYRDDFQSGARRFDVGERSNFNLMPMAVTAMRQILQWTPDAIQRTLAELTDAIAHQAEGLGMSAIPKNQRAGHLLGIRFPNGVPDGIQLRLQKEHIFVSIRGDAIRIAPHVYNTAEDVEKLMRALAEKEIAS